MADIDIVPKRRSGNLWLWIVIALVIVAALWFALGRGGTSRVGWLEQTTPATMPAAELAATPGAA